MEIVTIAFLSVLFLVAGVFYVNKILSMVIESEITPIQSLIYFFCFCLIVTLFFKVPFNWFRILAILIVFAFDLFIEPIKAYLNREDNNAYFMKKAMECDAVLLNNPYDWGTLSEKARCYFKMKDYEKAIEIQEKVVSMSKNDYSEIAKLKSYKKYLDAMENTDVKCWFCGAMVPYGVDKCYNCGRNMSIAQNIIDWLKKGGCKKLMVSIAGILVIFFLYNLVLSFLSDGLKFIVHLLTAIIIAGCIIYNIFHKEE